MDNSRIVSARKALGWTQQDLAERLGVTQQAVQRYEKQARDLKSSVLVDLSRELGVSVSYLLGLDDSPSVLPVAPAPSRMVPVVGRVAAGEAREAIERNDRSQSVTDELLRLCGDPVMVEVSGNSMNRLFPDGALLLVDRAAEVRNGDVAAVFVNGDDVTVKRVYFERGSVRLHPESYDQEYRDRVIDRDDPDAPSVHMFGKVVSYMAPMGWRA